VDIYPVFSPKQKATAASLLYPCMAHDLVAAVATYSWVRLQPGRNFRLAAGGYSPQRRNRALAFTPAKPNPFVRNEVDPIAGGIAGIQVHLGGAI
jgi:hypothetical protein